MSQNLIHLELDDTRLAAIGQALTTLEASLDMLIALEADERRVMVRMGQKSEQFCRETLTTLQQNPKVIPPSLGLSEGLADLQAYDRLRPVVQRLKQLTQRADDTQDALGSDIMALSLEGYALLKVAGRNQGLEGLRRELGGRFAKTRKPAPMPA